jgi:hypothetical protein
MNRPPQPPQQQIQLNPLQLLQLTAATLGELQKWIEKKQGTPDDSHPKKTIEARNSIFHTRLLVNVRLNEILREVAAKRGPAVLGPLPEFAPQYVDTESTKAIYEKTLGHHAC